MDAKFDTSEKCCHIMKKKPFKEYEKRTGRKPYIGTTQDEGFMRAHLYASTGCNVYDGKKIKSQPLGFWNRQDVLRYAVENDVEICSVYGDIIRQENNEQDVCSVDSERTWKKSQTDSRECP